MKISTTEDTEDAEGKSLQDTKADLSSASSVSSAVNISPGFWSTIRESLAGSHRDYTDGDIGRAILLLAIPMVLELSLESVFAVVDVFFVSRLGADAVATVGLTESMLTIMYAVLAGLSVGAMATVARRIGEKNPDGAARAAVQAIFLGVIVAIPTGIAGGLLAPRLLEMMGARPGVLANATYTRIMLGMNGVIVMLFLGGWRSGASTYGSTHA
jgi:Na+-driven multidrug efflux pump